ncbi:hypothetical protein [Microcoleus sp. POL10_C6]|uniref:hypothetical protein n=1 Tax=Microcoleus sp. POL10_C6 TaxID=2818852 RepID=UPI002FD3ED2B
MPTKCLVYRIALTTTSLVAILASSLTFLSAKVEATEQMCDSDFFNIFSQISCIDIGPTKPVDNDGSGGRDNYYYHVYIQNKTNRPIWVAVNFLQSPPGSSGSDSDLAVVIPAQWRTEGYWKLNPGQKTLILDDEERISNRIIYFHAHDEQGKSWGSSEKVFDIRGENQPFFEANMGDEIGKYTQSFTAD